MLKGIDLIKRDLGDFEIVLRTGSIVDGFEHHSLEIDDVGYSSGTVLVGVKESEEKRKLKPSDIVIKATIKEEVKKELGNKDGFYDGEWKVISFDHRDEELWLSNGRCSICRKYDEVDIIG